jgi:GxxExxY protein
MNVEPVRAMDPDLPHQVLSACLAVHQHLGPGLTREAYEECLAIELRELEVPFEQGQSLSFLYRGKQVEGGARLDLLVERVFLVQVLAADEVRATDLARMETLLRLSGLRHGMLVNFNVTALRKGVHRVTLKRRSGADGGED